jgi:hypothetical protein
MPGALQRPWARRGALTAGGEGGGGTRGGVHGWGRATEGAARPSPWFPHWHTLCFETLQGLLPACMRPSSDVLAMSSDLRGAEGRERREVCVRQGGGAGLICV